MGGASFAKPIIGYVQLMGFATLHPSYMLLYAKR